MAQNGALQYWEGIGAIITALLIVAGIIYKSLIFFYCKGKDTQHNMDNIKDLRTRVSSLETELLSLQMDITKYRTEEAKKLDEIKTNQSEIKTDIAVIKTILQKNFHP